MHRKKIYLLLFMFAFLRAGASDTLYFTGDISVSKKVSYRYILRFTIDEENKITGYSLTDPKGPYETKTKITGVYDDQKKIIHFWETSVLRSVIDTQTTTLCFVKASLKLKNKLNMEMLTGDFVGIDNSGQTGCGKGEIKLINAETVRSIQKRVNESSAKRENE